MKLNRTAAGHLAAFVTILIWGTTFISTKMLLRTFSPVEILFIRFVIGYLALWLVCPRSLRLSSARQEALYAAAGFCGVAITISWKISLSLILASNVGVSSPLRLSLPLSWVGCSWEERGRVSGSLPDFCWPWQASA